MAKPTTDSGGKSLVIVESPAKARTISKFLGREYVIEASIGHVRDLPQSAKQIPAQYKGEDWAYLGVNTQDNFTPVYVVPPGKIEQVRKLKGLLKAAGRLYLATDEDREGEAISWHLRELLNPKVPVQRLVFHEITREAIVDALAHPRDIDQDLVRAQETRRIIDRLYGYEVSPLLWRKVRPRLSAGRVQSVAVRLVVQRERDRMAFVSASYWDLESVFEKSTHERFPAGLMSWNGRRIPSSKDFDSATGLLKDPKMLLLDEPSALRLAADLRKATFTVKSLDDKPYTSRPYPPFTTSTLQQEANRKLGFTARRTMQVAQSLYETGHITYMRTDSTNLAQVAIDAARDLVASQYGREYLPDEPRIYRTKVKNAQEAHEAIRPAGHPFDLPETLKGELSGDEFRLYELVWKRTIASQMSDARGRRISVTIEGGEATLTAGGKTIDFAGYLRAYVEGSDDPQAELADKETILPSLTTGESLACHELEAKGHSTQPPARFNEATLTKTLEDLGIGRPSTYATIIETILARDYVFKKGNALVPTWTAFAVSQLLEAHLPDLVNYQFTAQMEDDLDSISRGESGHIDYLKSFYFGNGRAGLKKQLEAKVGEIDARDVSRIPLGKAADGQVIVVRVGRYGPFLESGERRASLPEGMAPDELTIPAAQEMLQQAAVAEEPLGHCPSTGKPVYVKVGRFGPYVQLGATNDDEKPKNASLLKGMKPEDVDVALALRLLSLPRNLGPHPSPEPPFSSAVVVASNGRFGPYVKCGTETRSLPAELSPLDVTLEQAVELLAQPKRMRRGFGAPREPIAVLGESPVTSKPVHLLEGRYGPYVTDGETNASIPKGTAVESVKLDEALALLAARAAAGPPKKAGRRTSQSGRAGAKRPAPPDAAAKVEAPAKRARKGSKTSAGGRAADFSGDVETGATKTGAARSKKVAPTATVGRKSAKRTARKAR